MCMCFPFFCVCMNKKVWETVIELSLNQHDKDTINQSFLFKLELIYGANQAVVD